jgi:DNA-binding FadR family transcriptional regulator
MRAAGADVAAFDAADMRFHIALAGASGNDAMHLVMRALRDAAAGYLLAALETQRDPWRMIRRLTAEHEQIVAAIESGDGDRAAGLVESHIRGFYLRHRRSAGT